MADEKAAYAEQPPPPYPGQPGQPPVAGAGYAPPPQGAGYAPPPGGAPGYAPPPGGAPGYAPPPGGVPGYPPQPGYAPPPGAPGYPPQPGVAYVQQPMGGPPPSTVHTTVVVHQTGHTPFSTQCPNCHETITTDVDRSPGVLAWLSCIGLICVGLWVGCCLIPFCIDSCYDVTHRCPKCRHIIGEYRQC